MCVRVFFFLYNTRIIITTRVSRFDRLARANVNRTHRRKRECRRPGRGRRRGERAKSFENENRDTRARDNRTRAARVLRWPFSREKTFPERRRGRRVFPRVPSLPLNGRRANAYTAVYRRRGPIHTVRSERQNDLFRSRCDAIVGCGPATTRREILQRVRGPRREIIVARARGRDRAL